MTVKEIIDELDSIERAMDVADQIKNDRERDGLLDILCNYKTLLTRLKVEV